VWLCCHSPNSSLGCRLVLLACLFGTAGLFSCCLPCGDATSALASLRLLSVLQRVWGLCSPQFRASSSWLPDTLGKWTPFVFVTFRRCTGDFSQQPFTLSHLRWLSAPVLPTFPCEHQQSANPYVAMPALSLSQRCRACSVVEG
jgi:hypothetical protein